MNSIKRIFPGATNGLINYLEENFHEIDGFVAVINLKDKTTMVIYDSYSYLEAVGMLEVAKDTVHTLGREGQFIKKR